MLFIHIEIHFGLHSKMKLFNCESNNILVPLAPQVQNPAQNIEFVQQHVFTLLKTAYPHLQE